jgi:M6 family metalloprotease-like protein
MLGRNIILIVAIFGSVHHAFAITPAQVGPLPDGYYRRLEANPTAFQFHHAFLALTKQLQDNRQAIKNGAQPMGIVEKVAGHRRIVVLLAQYSDTSQTPYRADVLAKELFGAGSATTLTAYYHENSYGSLEITGDVKPWVKLSRKESYYAGSDAKCYGTCDSSNIASMVEEAVSLNDANTQWGLYDNDSTDDKANILKNSHNNNDGVVDFVAIVHPGRGAECRTPSPTSLWSHHDRVSGWKGHKPIVTSAKSYNAKGGNITVDDYVLFPAVACDGVTPIPIGVIAHEIGHAFGLPDLYDTSREPKSEGIGNWDLMAAGSWGGDGVSPDQPVHMSAWSKGYLGWIRPRDVIGDESSIMLQPFETTGETLLVTIKNDSANLSEYYLISNRQRIGFDSKIPGTGMLILHIRETVLNDALPSNRVNVNPALMGVEVVEADGLNGLVHHSDSDGFRGGPGDTFPGTSDKSSFDNSTTPATTIRLAMCSITLAGTVAKLDIFFSRGSCRTSAAQLIPSASVKSLSQHPEAFADEEVRVSGRLTNQVRNYFRDPPNLILSDEEGFHIHVTPWLRMEIPRSPGQNRPAVMAEYLDQRVELTGAMKQAEASPSWTFQVHHADLLK